MTLTKIAKRRLTEVPVGTILPHYDFNGVLTFDTPIYKFCDGSIVADAESLLNGLYVPDMSNRYLVGFGSSQVDEVQLLTTNHVPNGGTFTITFGGQTTAAINWNDTDVASTAKFVAISTVGTGNAAVAKIGSNWRITFTGNLGGRNVNAVTATSSLTWAGVGIVTLTITTPTPGAGCDVGTAVWDASPVGNAGHQVLLVAHCHLLAGSPSPSTAGAKADISNAVVDSHSHTIVTPSTGWNLTGTGITGALWSSDSGMGAGWKSTTGNSIVSDSKTPNVTITQNNHTHEIGTGSTSNVIYSSVGSAGAIQNIQPRSLRVRFIIRIK